MDENTFLNLYEHLSGQLWLQGLLVAVGTSLLEDAGRGAVVLLVAAGRMKWGLAFSGMVAGAVVGDLGLYLAGRYATQFLLSRRWVNPSRLSGMETYFSNHAAKTVVFSRFLPGTRIPAFAGAGVARYPLPRFLLLLTAASALQAALFLLLGNMIGEKLFPCLKEPRTLTALVVGIVLAGVLVYWIRARHRR